MNLLNTIRVFNAIPPGVIKDAAAYVANVIDRASFAPADAKGVLFIVQLGTIDATMTALKVQQSDTQTDAQTLGGTPVDVVDVTTKPVDANDNGLFLVYVPMSKWTQRYLQIQGTAGNGAAGTYLNALAILDHAGETAATAAGLNATNLQIA